MTSRRRVVVIGTGGTISAVADARGRSGAGLSAEQIAESTPELSDRVDLCPADVRHIPGRAMTPDDMVAVARAVAAEIDRGCDGVVVTHGTDTLEETAYALALTLRTPVPVVVTGAMRLPGEPGHDGPANLRTAVVAACDPRLAAAGPVVAFQDEIHLARWVSKVHTTRVAAFASPGHGPAGVVNEDRLFLAHTGDGTTDHIGMPETLTNTRVELLWVAAGSDGALLDAAAAISAGIVVAGTGGGHTPPPLASAIGRAVAAGTPVVLASRCPAGPLLAGTYGGEGGEAHLRSLGAVPVGHLPALKARLRLQVALALQLAPDEVFPS